MKRIYPILALTILLVVASVFVVAGQNNEVTQLVDPISVDFQQNIPAEVVVSVLDSDGEPITVTVPISIQLDAEIQVLKRPKIDLDAETVNTKPLVFELEEAVDLLPVLNDMPTGYYLTEEEALGSNVGVSEAFSDTEKILGELEQWGRQGGFYNTYANSEFPIFGGQNVNLSTSFIVFETPEGAESYLRTAIDRELERINPPKAIVRLSAPKIGESSVAYLESRASGDENFPEFSVYNYWARFGNALIVVSATALPNRGDFGDVVTLVEVLANRVVEPR